jgi:hypothetical protein
MAARGEAFLRSATSSFDQDEVMQRFVAGTAGSRDYTVSPAGSGTLILTRRYIPTWAIIVAVLGAIFFLIGLIALFFRETETVTVTIRPTPTGSDIAVTGTANDSMAGRLNGVFVALQQPIPASRFNGLVARNSVAIANSKGTNTVSMETAPEERGRFLTDAERAFLASVAAPTGGPGWYIDPLGMAGERYWVGDHWTGKYRAIVQEPPASDSVVLDVEPSQEQQSSSDGVLATSSAGDTRTLVESLTHLHALHLAGGLSDEEYLDLKTRILGTRDGGGAGAPEPISRLD